MKLAGRVDSDKGNSTAAMAWAAMPSPRPVKPSRSVVVTFTDTRPGSTPEHASSG